jgi:hypothetical protein
MNDDKNTTTEIEISSDDDDDELAYLELQNFTRQLVIDLAHDIIKNSQLVPQRSKEDLAYIIRAYEVKPSEFNFRRIQNHLETIQSIHNTVKAIDYRRKVIIYVLTFMLEYGGTMFKDSEKIQLLLKSSKRVMANEHNHENQPQVLLKRYNSILYKTSLMKHGVPLSVGDDSDSFIQTLSRIVVDIVMECSMEYMSNQKFTKLSQENNPICSSFVPPTPAPSKSHPPPRRLNRINELYRQKLLNQEISRKRGVQCERQQNNRVINIIKYKPIIYFRNKIIKTLSKK